MKDGTIPETTQKMLIKTAQERKARLGIVSGRDLDYLTRVNSELGGVFTFLVAENGAISYFCDTDETVVRGKDWTREARKVFDHTDFEVKFFEIIGTARSECAPRITEALRNSKLEAKLALNKDSMMILPPNVDKGSGVAFAVAHYGSTVQNELTCFGDGENDIALFGPADIGVAVANAVDALKKIADVVTKQPGGLGVEEYLRETFFQNEL